MTPTDETRRRQHLLSRKPTNLVITWDWSVLRCRVVSQVEEHFIHVAPAPALGRIITLDDRVTCCPIMTGCMTTWRLIATTNVSAGPADSEVNPFATGFQTFLAAARAWCNPPNGAQMRATFIHDRYPPLLRLNPYSTLANGASRLLSMSTVRRHRGACLLSFSLKAWRCGHGKCHQRNKL